MQVDGRVDLGSHHVREPLGRQGRHQAVVQDARRVHHPGERAVGRYGVQYRGQRVAVGGVAGGDVDMGGAQGEEFGLQPVGAFRVPAAAAGEQQMPYAVLGDQVAGEQPAQRPGAAGDQDRSGRGGERRGVPGRYGGGGADEAGDEGGAPAHGDLGLLRGQGRGDGAGDARPVGAGVGVDEQEPAGVLRLRRPQQPPHGCVRQVGDVLTGPGGHGALRDDDEPGACCPLVGEPGAHEGQCLGRRRTGGGREVAAGGRRGADGHHDLGCGAVGEQLRHAGGVPDGVERSGVERSGVRCAEHGPAGGVHGVTGRGQLGGQRGPVGAEQCVAGGVRGAGELPPRHREQGEPVDRGHRRARGVGEGDGHRVRARRGDPHPHGRGSHRVQGDAAPRERQSYGGLVLLLDRAEQRGVQGGVQEGRVDAEPGGFRGLFLGERHLGVDLLAGAPGGAQALEGGAVAVAAVRDLLVEGVQVDAFGAGRRQDGRLGCGGGCPGGGTGAAGRSGRGGRGQHAGGVPRPGLVGAGGLRGGLRGLGP